jgi:hypothetical protein
MGITQHRDAVDGVRHRQRGVGRGNVVATGPASCRSAVIRAWGGAEMGRTRRHFRPATSHEANAATARRGFAARRSRPDGARDGRGG